MSRRTGVAVGVAAGAVLICLSGCDAPHLREAAPSGRVTSYTARAMGSSPRPSFASLATASDVPSATAAASCKVGNLVLSYDPSVDFQATGDRGDAFVLTSHGARACRLVGYPTITLRDRQGAVVPFRYTDGQSQYVTERPPEPFTVAQGGVAYVGVAKYRCDIGDQSAVVAVTMLLPGQYRTMSVPLAGRALNLAFCRGGKLDPGNRVAISPIEPTAMRVLS